MNLRTKIPLLATVLCLLPGVAAPGSFQDGESVLDAGIDREDLGTATLSKTGPLSVFASVEEAWERADADALVELLDERDRVTISFIHGGGRGGSFNRDQAYFLLHDAFRFSRVERFEFRRYWNLGDDGRSP
ncbi:MAG: hypothetical protein QGI43_08640, partial [Gemmatimonadota bacterium]|nr:hypothetical protein [Gemmatimonadota bacterium]